MKRRNSVEDDVNRVVGLIAFCLAIGAIAWILQVLVAVLTSPIFWVTAALVTVGGLILWVLRESENGPKGM